MATRPAVSFSDSLKGKSRVPHPCAFCKGGISQTLQRVTFCLAWAMERLTVAHGTRKMPHGLVRILEQTALLDFVMRRER
jgi:hypothetical protein